MMVSKKQGLTLLVLAITSALVMVRVGYAAPPDKVKGVADPGWHGMCILDGQPSEYLVDESKEKKGRAVPIYIFTAEGFPNGPGTYNPLGCIVLNDGTQVCYLPYRLQNNVFAGNGVLWRMFKVEAVGLYAGVPAAGGTVTLYSSGNPLHEMTRDLYTDPFLSEAELLNYPGMRVTDLGSSFNCPIIPSDGHPVINLNPIQFPIP